MDCDWWVGAAILVRLYMRRIKTMRIQPRHGVIHYTYTVRRVEIGYSRVPPG
jgi:hypothetical protein